MTFLQREGLNRAAFIPILLGIISARIFSIKSVVGP